LHATALRLPGHVALTDDGAPIDVICPPHEGDAFASERFRAAFARWFGECREGEAWFDGTPVASRPA